MAEEEKYFRVEIKEIIIYIFIGILLFGILPLIGGMILKGFETEIIGGQPITVSLTTYLGGYLIYIPFVIISLALIIYPIGRMVALERKQHPSTQDKPSWFTLFTVSLIQSPEENGALYRLFEYLGLKGKKNPMRWSLSIFRNIIIAILIFGTLGLLTIAYPQLSISSVPSPAQQISPASDIIFGAGVPSFAENGVLMFIFFLALGFDAYLCSRFRLGIAGFFLIGFIFISPLMGLSWMSMHTIVYGNQEAKLMATFIFGWLGSTITLLTASFIFWMAWHFFNNFFIKIASYASSNEDVMFISALFLIGLFLVWIIIEVLIHRFRKKQPEIPPSPQ